MSAVSSLGKSLEYARNLIASSAKWQELCEVLSESAARDLISFGESSGPESLPECVVSLADASQNGIGSVFEGQGVVVVSFVLEIPEEYVSEVDGELIVNYSGAYKDHVDLVGTICDQMKVNTRNASTANGYLAMDRFELSNHGLLDEVTENGKRLFGSDWMMGYYLQ